MISAVFSHLMRDGSLRDRLQRSLGDAYTLERELGGGGMSRVFVAEDPALGRKVVVKVLSTELSGAVNADRFNREIRVAATLQHACIVPVHSAGEADGLPYYTMPFVEGETLRARIARDGALPLPDVLRILRDVAQALSYAHERGVVHRDIKPDNILLTRHHALVTDFGVAKALAAAKQGERPDGDSPSNASGALTELGVSLGTPAYMAPEQAVADPGVDHRADLYALGATAHEMLCGRQLFARASAAALIVAHATETPEPVSASRPDVPPALDALVTRLLAKSPADRPQSADDLLNALDAVAAPSGETFAPSAPVTATVPGRRLARWMAAGIVAAIAVVSLFVFLSRRSRTATADVGPSVAVLPFVNMSGDSKDDYLGDGLSEELIDALSKLERLKVAARASSFAFRNPSGDVRSIGRRLGVASVLTGSIRRAGNRLRVTTQLVNASTGYNLWSDKYDREMTDVFAVQDDITRSIVAALRVRLGSADRDAIQTRPAKNIQAYESYLKGQHAWRQRGRGLVDAMRYFAEAIAVDSTYAPAYAALAGAVLTSVTWNILSPDEGQERARAASLKAIALDSTLADGHGALATVLCNENKFAPAEQEFQRAIQLNPGLARAHFSYAWCLTSFARDDNAIREARRAQDLDPLNPSMYSALGRAYLHARRYREGVEAMEPVRELQPDQSATHGWRSQLLVEMGDTLAAIREAKIIVQLSPTSLWSAAYAGMLARVGMADSARAMLRGPERDSLPPSYWIAQAYISLGDRDRAFAWLNRALDEHSSWVSEIRGARWDPVRTDPRYIAVARKIGLLTAR
jgi:serine/threonine-protein kinase